MHTKTTEADPQRLLLPREIAKLFSVDPKTVTRWADEGRIPSFRTPGGHRRFREADVLAICDGGPTDLNTLVGRAQEVADHVEFDWRNSMSGDEPGVTVIAWKGDVCEYATAAQPAEALAAAVAKLSAYLTGGTR